MQQFNKAQVSTYVLLLAAGESEAPYLQPFSIGSGRGWTKIKSDLWPRMIPSMNDRIPGSVKGNGMTDALLYICWPRDTPSTHGAMSAWLGMLCWGLRLLGQKGNGFKSWLQFEPRIRRHVDAKQVGRTTATAFLLTSTYQFWNLAPTIFLDWTMMHHNGYHFVELFCARDARAEF